MTDTETRPEVESKKRYGGFYKPRAWGVGFGAFQLGPVGSIVAGVTAIGGVLLMTQTGLLPALVLVTVVYAVLYLASTHDRHGKTWFQRRRARQSHHHRVRTGQNLYLPSGLTRMGAHRLPGVLASSELAAYTGDDGETYAVLRYPHRDHHVVSLRARPDGASLLDHAQVTHQVGSWGDWLAGLAYEEGLVQAAVTIETSPDGGPLMRRAIRSRQSDRAHPVATAWIDGLLDKYPRGSLGVTATISLTLRSPADDHTLDGSKIPKRDREDSAALVGQQIAARLPHIMDDLVATGAGAVDVMDCDDIIETVRCAYDPDARGAYDEARARGQEPPVTMWHNVGPSGAVAEWGYYQHSGYASVTWEFTSFTTSSLTPQSLLPLLEAHDDVAIKRITIIYRPLAPERSSTIVEANHKAAEDRLNDAKKPTARQRKAVRDADQARESEADGFAVCDFALLVTATVRPDKLAAAHAAISRLGPTARLHLRPMNGLHDVGFAAGIGVLGLVSESYLALPPALMNGV